MDVGRPRQVTGSTQLGKKGVGTDSTSQAALTAVKTSKYTQRYQKHPEDTAKSNSNGRCFDLFPMERRIKTQDAVWKEKPPKAESLKNEEP